MNVLQFIILPLKDILLSHFPQMQIGLQRTPSDLSAHGMGLPRLSMLIFNSAMVVLV